MSKIRNSLGVLVLLVYGDSVLSFAEYKARTGIDLNEVVEDNTTYGPIIKTTKLICLSDGGNNYQSVIEECFPPLGVANIRASAYTFPDEDNPTNCVLLWYGTPRQDGDGFTYTYGIGMLIDPVGQRIGHFEL